MVDETTASAQDAQPQDVQPQVAAPDLSDWSPVKGTQKVLPGQQPQAALADWTPIEGTQKKLAAPPAAPSPVQASGVLPPATGIGPRESGFQSWLQDVQSDVKNGSSATWVGAMLRGLGAKGTNYGVDPRIGEFMAGPALGIPKALEGSVALHKEVYKGITQSDMDPNKVAGSINDIVGGIFQSTGAVGAVEAPGGEALAVVVPAMIAQSNAQRAAEYMGATPEVSELVGNVTAVVLGGLVHAKLHPVLERFGVAVNAHTAAEQEYTNRSRNLETARGQAAEMQKRAIDAADRETRAAAHQAGVEGSEPTIGSPEQTDQARQLANEAAKNVGDAQKAFDAASQRRADAQIAVEKLGRQITKAADKNQAADYESKASEQKKASDLFQKAVPSRGANRYSPEDEEVARAHMEAAKAGGAKITDLPSAYEAVENGRQGIEDKIKPYVEKYADEPVTSKPEDSPKMKVAQKLEEMAKVDGNFSNAMDALSEFNLTDPTMSEAQDTLTKLNNYNRSAMKGANNWDIYNMIETNPDFAARFFMADELRDAIYNNLEGHGVEGIREARGETKSLINVRDAIGAQIKANRGGTTVRGSGNSSTMRGLLGKLTGKAIKGTGIAAGANIGGPAGAVGGGMVGEAIGQPIEDFIAPRDMTRDEHIEKSMKYKGTNRKPVEIRGTGTPAVIPTEAIPPAVKQGPSSVELTPRENTDLHAELAAHYGESSLEESSYKELEQNLRDDAAAKNRSGVALDPAEKTLLTKILKADTADRAATQAAGKPNTEVKIDPKVEGELITEADKRASEGESTKLNPTLVSLGRGDESALVSHSLAMKAHAPAGVIPGLPEGITSEDALGHEFAHLAIGAVDGLEPIEIRSDIHPKSEKGAGATAVFNGAAIRDAAGNIDQEALANQEVQWLTQKMAGPASHEVFKGMTRDEVKALPANRSDFRTSRAIIREIHPDFTASQVEQAVDLAYDRARDFLTKPHIADRIRANAAVREEGLSQTLHASHGRVTQFAEDIRNAHNEYTGTEPQPDGAGAGEGGEKVEKGEAAGKKTPGKGEGGRGEGAPKPAGEAAAARGVAESQVERLPNVPNLRVPPERTTGEFDEAIKKGGAVPGGIQHGDPEINLPDLVLFHDPATGSTLALPTDKITPEGVKAQLQKSRDMYLAAEDRKAGVKPEDVSQSQVTKTEPKTISDKLVDTYGTTQDPREAGFILSDGRMVPLHGEHNTMLENVYNKYGDISMADAERSAFIDNENAVRTRFRTGRGGQEVVFSVPKNGVSEPQLQQIRKAVGKVGREGNVVMERTDATPDNPLYTRKEFPRVSDVDQMLREIGAHPEQKIEPNPQIVAHESNGGSTFTPEGENLDGKDTHAVGAYPDRTLQVDKLTPEVLAKFKADNADVLSQGDHAVGTWKDPDTGKTVLDVSKTIKDRQEAIAAGKAANQKAIYHLGGDGEIQTGGTGEGTLKLEESNISKALPKGVKLDNDWHEFPGGSRTLTAHDADGNEVGHIHTVGADNGRSSVGYVTVSEEMQGRGIGESLYRAAIEDANNRGLKNFKSDIASQVSSSAQRVWQKLAKSGDYSISQDRKGRWVVDLSKEVKPEESQISKSPKGSSVPLMTNPLEVEGSGEKGKIMNMDVAKALNGYSKEKNPSLEPGSEPKEMTDRAERLAEDEAKYQLAQGKTGTEWYTTEMKDHDKSLQAMRPELAGGETLDSVPGHPVKLSLFKAAEAVLSSGQKPYGNFKAAVKAWDAYNETGQFPRLNPATGKSWGPRGQAAYGNALDMINKLVADKGEKGAADWLMTDHPVSELKEFNKDIKGKKTDTRPGAMILGEKRGPFMQNLHGVESAFTADMWVSRTWNRWMGTMEFGKNSFGDDAILSDLPRNGSERALMKESFENTAKKLNLTTSSLQAVLWYYEQALYRAHGIPKESWSFKDAAARAAKEESETEAEQNGFNFGANEGKKEEGGFDALGSIVTANKPKFDALGRPFGGRK